MTLRRELDRLRRMLPKHARIDVNELRARLLRVTEGMEPLDGPIADPALEQLRQRLLATTRAA